MSPGIAFTRDSAVLPVKLKGKQSGGSSVIWPCLGLNDFTSSEDRSLA